jgi:hypothetical protein
MGDVMSERETGSATQPCATCGTDLALVDNADGSVSTVTCTKCYPSEKAAAEAAPVAREKGSDA